MINKNQQVSGSVSLSYTTGRNEYITQLRWVPDPPDGMGDLVNNKLLVQWEGYIGAILAVTYDYMLWKNRINVGVDASLRKYEGDFPLFTNYGFHAGINF